jgi:hypothetical protein
MDEKFAANPVTGTGSMSVSIATSPGRSGFGPQLSLSYDSGAGNGPFGFGWSLSIPAITRKTDKGLPRYCDAEESDVFILSGAEDLVSVLRSGGMRFEDDTTFAGYLIHRYRPPSKVGVRGIPTSRGARTSTPVRRAQERGGQHDSRSSNAIQRSTICWLERASRRGRYSIPS